MYILEITETFSAAHALRGYPGACARTHGHNWTVCVRVSAGEAGDDGMTADYALLKQNLHAILLPLDHNLINDHPHFATINPTSEMIARFVYEALESNLPPVVTIEEVRISETPAFTVIYKKK